MVRFGRGTGSDEFYEQDWDVGAFVFFAVFLFVVLVLKNRPFYFNGDGHLQGVKRERTCTQ